MTHKTKGIVLKTIKFGDTSIIATIYTQVFGVQSYIVKGVRQASKKGSSKGVYFQPAAILDMVVYHNELKKLNFIQEYNWGYICEQLFFNVMKNTVALYIVEVLQHSLKQPEANPELFHLIEDTLIQLDKGSATLAANLPLYFNLHLAGELGFRINGEYSVSTPILDLKEGGFVAVKPEHAFYVEDKLASVTSQLLNINFYTDLEQVKLGRGTRQELISLYQNYIALHVQDFGEIRSLPILKEIFD